MTFWPQKIRARARVDRRTKNLVTRLRPGEIAVIDHPDLDEVAARSLLERRVRAVLNAGPSISGRYPNPGPKLLLSAGVPMLDGLGSYFLDRIRDGDLLEVRGDQVWKEGSLIAQGELLTSERVADRMVSTRENLAAELRQFLRNTLNYAQKEAETLLRPLPLPLLRTPLTARQVLVVVRGQNYKEDLRAIDGYLRDVRPVLIGVDGGADALLEQGFRPNLIIGDMDSVSDRALNCGAELLVHAYPDGRAPGLGRLQARGLRAHTVPAPGTSEDLALLLAYELGAALIIAVGTHTSLIDFLEKGRAGMGSTLLVRLKVGARLVDARGVNLLYRRPLRVRHVGHLALAALIPLTVAAMQAPVAHHLLFLWWMHLRITVGF